jgi:hypothetical protein
MKTIYSLYKEIWLFFIISFKNSLYISSYRIITYTKNVQLSCLSKQDLNRINKRPKRNKQKNDIILIHTRLTEDIITTGGNVHLASRFWPNSKSNMVLEHLQDPLGRLFSGFNYKTTHHLHLRTKPNSIGREKVY